jgi:hypothetical protein
MRQAIALPYAEGQNEPSKPVRRIVNIPDDVEERNALLTDLFYEYVIGNENERTLELKFDDGNVDDFGDIIVSLAEDEGVYLYITFIEG